MELNPPSSNSNTTGIPRPWGLGAWITSSSRVLEGKDALVQRSVFYQNCELNFDSNSLIKAKYEIDYDFYVKFTGTKREIYNLWNS